MSLPGGVPDVGFIFSGNGSALGPYKLQLFGPVRETPGGEGLDSVTVHGEEARRFHNALCMIPRVERRALALSFYFDKGGK